MAIASVRPRGAAVKNPRKPECPACGHRDCPGWQTGDPIHEYRGKDNWFLGCHCPGCSRSRSESGGFLGALASALKGEGQP